MKKLCYVLVMALCLIPSFVSAKEKVKVYLFRGDGCPHCEDAIEFFTNVSDEEKEKFELVQYEVWYSEENEEIMNKVASKLREEVSGVPYIVVGKKSFSGFNEEKGNSILALVDEMYENGDFTDVLKENNTTIIIVICLGVIAVTVGAIIYFRKKNIKIHTKREK